MPESLSLAMAAELCGLKLERERERALREIKREREIMRKIIKNILIEGYIGHFPNYLYFFYHVNTCLHHQFYYVSSLNWLGLQNQHAELIVRNYLISSRATTATTTGLKGMCQNLKD